MALLDANLYHTACHMMLDWCHHSSLKQWVQVEQALAGIPLESVPWCIMDMPRQIPDYLTIGETQRICLKACRDFSVAPSPSPLTPIVGNPVFSPGLQDLRFRELKLVEQSQACHLIVNGWYSWQKVQLSHFIGSLPLPEPFQRSLTSF